MVNCGFETFTNKVVNKWRKKIENFIGKAISGVKCWIRRWWEFLVDWLVCKLNICNGQIFKFDVSTSNLMIEAVNKYGRFCDWLTLELE